MLALFTVGLLIAAALRPLIVPVSRALGLMRANFAGTMIPTACGWVLVAATAIGFLAAGLLSPIVIPQLPHALGGGMAAAALLYGALGWLDDRCGDRSVKGLRGHLRSFFRERRVTTGFVKAAGGGVFGLALAAWMAGAPRASLPGHAAAVALGGAVIALWANAINLLDLRPLRAIKGFGLSLLLVTLLAAICAPARLAGLAWLALPSGALAAYIPLEARCRAMLGDTGANALGAMAGLAAVWTLPAWPQFGLAAALVALHLFAERHSITATLAAHPWLDRLDRWGWQADARKESP